MLASEPVVARVSTRRREFLIGGAAALIALVAITLWRGRSQEMPPPSAPTVVRSVVVLPFETPDTDRDDFWQSYGIAHELSAALASIPGLRVVPVPLELGFKRRSGDDLREVAKLLNVGAVLQGAPVRVGNELHVTLWLTAASVDSEYWHASLKRDTADLHGLENEIATSVGNVLRRELGLPDAAALAASPLDHRAHTLLLRAVYLLDRGGRGALDSAVALLEQAVKRDRSYAAAWSRLALLRAHNSVGDDPVRTRRVLDAAHRAMTLDLTLSEPHVALGRLHATRSDTTRAIYAYLSAIRRDPSSALARLEYSQLLSASGKADEALREARRAHELDPLDAEAHQNYVQMLTRAGRGAQAREEATELRRITRYLRTHR